MIKAKKILIYAPNWLGDIIMSIPAIKLLRKNYNNSHIAILIKPAFGSIFKDSDIINEVIPLNEMHTIRAKKFDMVIIFQNSFQSAFNMFFTFIKRRVGYSGDYRDFFLTHVANRDPVRWIHTSDYYLHMLKILGIENIEKENINLYVSDNQKKLASDYLKKINAYDRPIIAYGIGATNAKGKIWDESYFAEVANVLSKKYNAYTLFITTQSEKGISDKINSMLDEKAIVPYLDLYTIAGILSNCIGFIGNDSGAMHLASSLSIPTLALYFATPAGQNYPRGEKSDAIVRELPCKFCGGRKCKIKTFECRQAIKPNEVIEKFSSMISEYTK